MDKISNKFLVFLLVIAILVTVVGTWYSIDKIGRLEALTGHGTVSYVNVTIEGKTSINVTQPYCGFGTGSVTAGYDFATLNQGTSPSPYCGDVSDTKGNWTNTSAYDPACMIVANVGNKNAWVNVSSGKTAANFIGGTSPNVTAWSENKESGSCSSGGSVTPRAFPGLEMDTTNRSMCSCLYPNASKNELYVGCYLKIPSDAVAEAKTDTWTFTTVASVGVPDCGSD